jgi:hypothetical protein
MIIASIIVVIVNKNIESKKSDKGKNNKIDEKDENGKGIMTKNVMVLVAICACCVAITGYVARIMDMNKRSDMSNEILQQ